MFEPNTNFHDALDGAYFCITRLMSRHVVARYTGPNGKFNEEGVRIIGTDRTGEEAYRSQEHAG